jgi:hypothetical protein
MQEQERLAKEQRRSRLKERMNSSSKPKYLSPAEMQAAK